MISYDLADILFQELDYKSSFGFNPSITRTTDKVSTVLDVDGVYTVQRIPIIYFKYLDDPNPELLWRIHKHVWNESQVPLLYVFSPQEILIYNSYMLPASGPAEFMASHEERLLQHLTQLINVEVARRAIRQQLSSYDRVHLETGAFWASTDGRRIKRESRADQHLLRAMDQARRRLLEAGLSNHLAYTLLGRSIFIRYLGSVP